MKGNTFKKLTTCESLHELEAGYRGKSRATKKSGMELLIEMVYSLYQLTIAINFSVLDVEAVPSEHTVLDDKAF